MLKQIALVALMGLSASVAMAGPWQVKLGASALTPTGDYNTHSELGKIEADHEYGFTPSVEYFFNDNFSTELLLATPFNQSVTLKGSEIAKFKHLPPTLTVKYNLKNSTRFTPYIGVGATVLIPWDVDSKLVKDVDTEVGFAGQLGFNYQPADAKNWGVFVDVRYADLSPEVKLKQAGQDALGKKHFDLDVNPVVYTLGYSYRF